MTSLISTICDPRVNSAFDHFFTSVTLMHNISYPVVGTCLVSRKFMPKFDEKLKDNDSQFLRNI